MRHSARLKEMVPRALLLAALWGGLVLAGCGSSPMAATPPQAPEVGTITVAPERIVLTTELPGRTSPFLVAEIRPQVSGLIQKRLFEEGSDVKAGRVLYEIDPASFQAALNNANAALGRAEVYLPSIRSRASRYEELLADKAVSQQDYDDAAAALKQAEADIEYWKASVETARIQLGYTNITAPISGRIGRSGVTTGAIVTAYQPVALATIQQLNPIYLDVPQSTSEMLRLKRRLEEGRLNHDGKNHRKVNIVLEDGTAYPLEGTFQFRDVTVEQTTGSVLLRVIVPNPEGILLPGMFVRAILKEGENAKAILVPQQSVSRDPKGNPMALVVDDAGKVGQRKLVLDRAIGDRWLVVDGLAPGDKVIVEGIQKVRPGMIVKTVSFNDGREKGAGPGAPVQPVTKSN